MSLPGINKIESSYLKTTNSFGETVETKFWGPLSLVNSFQYIDAAARALCSLSKNTYNDTLLKGTESYDKGILTGQGNTPIGTSEKLQVRIASYNITPSIVVEKVVWSGALNPEATFEDVKAALGFIPNHNGYYQDDDIGPTTLFSLIDPRTIVPQGQYQIAGRSQSTISVNERLAL